MPATYDSLLDSNPSQAQRPIEYFPLTTQGKITLKLWREENEKVKSREKPPKYKASKSGTLPPPGEITEIEELLKLKKVSIATDQRRDKRVPITTQQKIIAAKAKERTRGNKHGDGWKPTRRRVKMAGLLGQMKELEMQKLPRPPRDPADPGVLFRQTAKSRRWAELHPREQSIAETPTDGACHLLRLPLSVRKQIWTLVVVDTDVFIWPESPTGQEQPDLAMTCKEIRGETLPLFYALNTFGVVLSPPVIPPRSGSRRGLASRLTGLAAVRKWAQAIESSSREGEKWLRKITHWAFEYKDDRRISLEPRSKFDAQQRSFVVMVHFPALAGRAVWRVPEIHQEAACVLPGWSECGKCVPGKAVAAVNETVRTAQKFARTSRGTDAGLMIKLAEQLRDWRDLLDGAKCRR